MVVASALARPAPAFEVEPSVEIEAEWALGIRDARSQKLEASIEPQLRIGLGRGFDLTAIGRLRPEAFDRIEPGDPRPEETSPLSRRGFLGENVDVELRELFVEKAVGPVFLRIGKQQIVWGESDGLKVLDVVNPQDFREFILDEFEDSRIPLWAVNIEVPVGPVVAELLWVPDPSFHEIPGSDAEFAFAAERFLPPSRRGFIPALGAEERPQGMLDDGDAGLRLTSHVQGVDLSLVYLYRYDDRPVFRASEIDSPQGPVLFFTPQYKRTHLVGGTFSTAWGNLTVRGEAALQTDRFLSTTDPSDGDALVEEPELSTVLGLDWFGFRRTFLSLQVFQTFLLGNASGLLQDRVDTNFTFFAQRSFRHERVRLEGIWLQNLNDGDGLLRPRVVVEVRDGVDVWLGGDVFYGNRDGIFGQFDAKDRVTLGVQWGF